MNLVFMDTVGLLALWNTDDQWHETAEKAFAKSCEPDHAADDAS